MNAPLPPPGWYPDQMDARFVRWWDGRTWTPHTQPAQPPAQQAPVGGTGAGPMFTDPSLTVVQAARALGILELAAYQVFSGTGQLIGSIQQLRPRQDQGRSEQFEVRDAAGALVLRFGRPLELASAHRPRFEVTYPDGRLLGVIESEKLVGRITFGFTVGGVRVAGVKAEGMRNRKFALTDQHSQPIAEYDRRPPSGQYDDSYVITRHRPTPEPLGTFVLIATVVLDAAFFVSSLGGPLR